MMTLAHPPNRWNAETTTAAALVTLRPAVDPITGSMVKADVRRLEPWYGFKNGCVVSPRQVGSCAERVRSQLWESEMSDERPLHELNWDEACKTDRFREWVDLHKEAARVLKDAEKLMHRWTWASKFSSSDLSGREDYVNMLLTEDERRGKTPFDGKYPIEQLDRIWQFLVLKVHDTCDSMWEQGGYTEDEVVLKIHEYNLMLKLMWEGARPGDVEPVSTPATPVSPVERSESPIEKTLLTALRRSGWLCADPEKIGADCEAAPDRCGIFIYQQAAVLHYRADFLLGAMAAPDAAPHWVVVECDGHQFHERTQDQAEHDRARDRAMTAAGYQVFRFTGREIQRDARRCANEVLAHLRPFARPQS
jgi:very-short-patch-repair endonuclease